MDKSVSEFITHLASDAPVPGGGSAAALIGAQGAALVAMVANLTLGRKRYQDCQAQVEEVLREVAPLQVELLALIDEDTKAFQLVMAAYAMPHGNDQETSLRRDAIQASLQQAAQTPSRMMRASLKALRLAEMLSSGHNRNATSDLGVAVLSLAAAIRSAWLNVLVNLGSIDDGDFTSSCRAEGEAILAEALPLADRLSQELLGGM